ncbi:MAG TPA: alpha/beta fold hydrolase [Ornithinicoccus sp.]|nr:alpha/beta fold hydrolase [Ornithinicoccus sp.]
MRVSRLHRDGLVLDVRDAGPEAGEPVVLLHGFPADSSCWDLVAPRLHGAGLRTLAPDQRGYSPGARPRGRAAYRVRELVGDALALLDAAGLPAAHVVGHDWGGAVAWALAAAAPDRVRSLTVLSTPHPAALVRAVVGGDQALRSAYMAVFQLPVLPEWLLGRRLEGLLRRSGLPAEPAARYSARLAEPGALSAALGWYRAVPLSWREPTGRVRVPTTYLWGERDGALGPRAAKDTARYVLAPYEFRRLAAGHWLPERHPDEVADAVLARVRGVGSSWQAGHRE